MSHGVAIAIAASLQIGGHVSKELTAKQMARAVEKLLGDTVYKVPNSKRNKTYDVLVKSDGMISCPCTGWVNKKEGKPRWCRHCRDAARDNNLQLECRGDYYYVVS